ncbi:MAG TPA: hypothetical protein VGR61_02800, partial [Candidatus Dormibacteraeota bacterium]|nr:hypothetical protein [Candidatus Dormibacteraeota bacterium]
TLLGGGGGFFGGLKKAALGATASIAEGQARKDLTTSLDRLKRLLEASPRKAKAARPAARPAPGKPAAKAATAKQATPKAAAKPGANGRAASGGRTSKK